VKAAWWYDEDDGRRRWRRSEMMKMMAGAGFGPQDDDDDFPAQHRQPESKTNRKRKSIALFKTGCRSNKRS
jgi:hypothetical protein